MLGFSSLADQPLASVPSPFGSSGVVVIFYNGVSKADGVTYFSGISRPTVALAPAGGGNYTVMVTGSVSGDLRPDRVSHESYLIDGQLP